MWSKRRQRIAGLVERTPLIESEVDGRPHLAEMRMPADRRRVQAAGRDQPVAAAVAEERKRGRGRLLLGQSCARGGDCGAAARDSGGDRDADGRAAGENRRHPRRRRRNHLLRPRAPRAARRFRRRSPRRPGRRWCRASTTRRSSPARARSGSRSSSSWARRRRASYTVRRRRARFGNRIAAPDAEIVDRRAGILGRHDAVRSRLAKSCRSRPTRPTPCATRCRLRAYRRLPSHPGSAARRRWRVSDAEAEQAVRFAWEHTS